MGARPRTRQPCGMWRPALLDDSLLVVAQPIVRLRTTQLVAEELVPVVVRPCPSRTGVIEIDTWLVQRAAQVAAAHERRVHVSVSARSLTSDGFAARVRRAIELASVDPRLVTLEIDEATAARGDEGICRVAWALADYGCRIAVNDFALRFPQLDWLARLPVELLKIDPWLIADADLHDGSAATVREIVQIAGDLDVRTIAEGVNDEQLTAILRMVGIDYGQGFHRQR
jgi:EAL domain-containing protein (putative c-di-GMP-specific phosphodiesterase class I)